MQIRYDHVIAEDFEYKRCLSCFAATSVHRGAISVEGVNKMMKFLGLLILSLCLASTVYGQSAFQPASTQTVGSALGTNLQNAVSGVNNLVSNAASTLNSGSAASWNIPANSPFPTSTTTGGTFQTSLQGIPTGGTFFDPTIGSGVQSQSFFNNLGNTQGINFNSLPLANQGINFNSVPLAGSTTHFNSGVPLTTGFPTGGEVFLSGTPGVSNTFFSPPGFTNTIQSAPFFTDTFQNTPLFNSQQMLPTSNVNLGAHQITGGQSFHSFNQFPDVFSNQVPLSPTFFSNPAPIYNDIQAFSTPYLEYASPFPNVYNSGFNSMTATGTAGLQSGQTVMCYPVGDALGKK